MPLKADLTIETALYHNRTILKKAFYTHPFKLADVTEDRKAGILKLMIRSSSPGVLDGDDYQTRIDVAEGCSLEMETQSYQRLFQMKNGASQNTEVYLHRNSSFTYLPHPAVPHQGSVFSAKNSIHVAEGCTLIWGEVISCGRKLNGEVFLFSSYHSLTQIFKNEKLVVKENLLMKPAQTNISGMGRMEGFSHQSTLLYLNETFNTGQLTAELVHELKMSDGIIFGVSALPVKGVIVRMLGNKGELLFHLQKKLAAFISAHQKIRL